METRIENVTSHLNALQAQMDRIRGDMRAATAAISGGNEEEAARTVHEIQQRSGVLRIGSQLTANAVTDVSMQFYSRPEGAIAQQERESRAEAMEAA